MPVAASAPASPEGAADCGQLDGSRVTTMEVPIGPERLSLADFLVRCGQSMESHSTRSSPAPELVRVRDAFISAGLAALQRAADNGAVWLQYGLSVGSEHCRGLHAELGETARELVAEQEIDGFFFMHKPPGVRVRFETAGGRRDRLETILCERFHAWQDRGLIGHWHPAVYEPEAYLFGGPASMRSVHRLFTADSLTWLSFHALAHAKASDEPPGPAWAMSLAMLRALLDGLAIEGWEDLDVWDRVRWQTGRRLGAAAKGSDGFTQLVGSLRQAWSHPDALNDRLSPQARQLLDEYRRSVHQESARWIADYFGTQDALIGPREAAAYLVVFHWNRGCFPLVRQAMIAEALATRAGDRGR